MPSKNHTFPVTLAQGGSRVTIYEIGKTGRTRYQVAYYLGPQRNLKNFTDFSHAKQFAQEQLGFAVAGRKTVAEMTEDDRNTFSAAKSILEPLGIGLIPALKDFETAYKIMRGYGSVALAAEGYVQARQAEMVQTRATRAICEEFIAFQEKRLENDPKARRDVCTVRSHCRQFARWFKYPIHEIKSRDIVHWLNAYTVKKRTFNNKRITLVRLFHYAKQQGYLPEGKLTAADLTPRYKKLPHREVTALPPAVLRAIFDKAVECNNREAILYFAFASQTGMRTSELQGLL